MSSTATRQESGEKRENGTPNGARPAESADASTGTRLHLRLPVVIDLQQVHVPGGRLVWWGGLALLAALDVLEWPVAAVVAIGSALAAKDAKSGDAKHGRTANKGGEQP
jgi:hypothetical protein